MPKPPEEKKEEEITLARGEKGGIGLKGLISNLMLPQENVIIFYDSLRAICLAKDQVHHERKKHMDIKYHFICSKKVDTRENLDDMFMKPIPRSKLIHCLDLLNIDYWK